MKLNISEIQLLNMSNSDIRLYHLPYTLHAVVLSKEVAKSTILQLKNIFFKEVSSIKGLKKVQSTKCLLHARWVD